MAAWTARSRRKGFDLHVCREMEDLLWNGRDLVYTEKGLFGLTNAGEAREG